MTQDAFMKHMQDIIKIFGAKEYENRMPLIYETVSDLPEKNFAWICKHFCMTVPVKYPPLPTHFEEAAIEQRKKLSDGYGYKKESYDVPMPAGDALNDVLKRLGVANLTEAIKRRKGNI